jgi:thiopeptide-type bacteriocin biosynthesis protein
MSTPDQHARHGAAPATLANEPPPDQWLYFRLATDRESPHEMIRTRVYPALTRPEMDAHIGGWWWVNKADVIGPAVRVRIRTHPDSRMRVEHRLATEWTEGGLQCTVVPYEPEVRLFGGGVGMELAHELFCADSAFVARWLAQDRPKHVAIPEGLSITIVLWLLAAAGLDAFERWDVFEQVCDLRARRAPATPALDEECRRIASAVVRNGHVVSSKYAASGAFVTDFRAVVERLGIDVQRAYFRGQLTCGRRQFLVPVILFHGNRIGLSPHAQPALAAAVAEELATVAGRKRSTRA